MIDNRPPPPPPPGTIVGQVVLADGVPAPSARVVVLGTPRAGNCDATGVFEIRGVPPGGWRLSITHSLAPVTTIAPAAAASGEEVNAGVIKLKGAGSVRGRVGFLRPDDLTTAVVAVPELGIAAQPNAGGGYLLQGVAAGARDVVLLHARYGSASHRKQSVDVIALQTVDGPNFIQEPPQGPPLLDFGLVIINTGGQLIWKLANPDALATTVTSIAIAGPESVRFQVGTLSAFPIPVGSAGLDVPVTLDASSTGSFSADLSVQGTAEGVAFMQTATLKAVVTPPPTINLPDVELVPVTLDFGTMPGMPTRTVLLNNNGDGSGTIDIATANGPFQLINPPFPLLLAAHTSEIVTVQAVPQSSSGTVVGLVSFVCEPGQRVLTLNITALWS